MAKKRPILIPFHGVTGDMQVEMDGRTGHIEPGPSEEQIWWDTEKSSTKRWWWYDSYGDRSPHDEVEPPKTRRVQYVEVPNKEYESRMEDLMARRAEWDERVASGKIIRAPRYIWKENHVFEATLRITGSYRGRSAARFLLRNTEAPYELYHMTMDNTHSILVNGTVSEGKIKGKWTFSKRGAYYSLVPVFDDPKELEEACDE